jgi:hypothetical protein
MKGVAVPIHFCHKWGRRASGGGARPGGGGLAFGRRKEKGNWAKRLRRPVVLMGQCEGFGPGEERGCGGSRWAKKPERLGPAWEIPRKIQIGLPRPTG